MWTLYQISAQADDAPGDTVMDALPRLRAEARLYLHDVDAADRLVERTLEEAINALDAKPREVSVTSWLVGLLRDAYRRTGTSICL